MTPRLRVYAAVCLVTLLLTSCSYSKLSTAKSGAGDVSVADSIDSSYSATGSSVSISGNLYTMAAALDSSPGRVALSLIICKLDSSRMLAELSQKDAQSLFDTLKEIAQQKSQTLESLDDLYDLKDILASEKIYVLINSNAVTSSNAPQSSGNSVDVNGWIEKFEKAYAAG